MAGFIVYQENGWTDPPVRQNATYIEAADKLEAKRLYEEQYGNEVFFAIRRLELKQDYTDEILMDITGLSLEDIQKVKTIRVIQECATGEDSVFKYSSIPGGITI